MEQTGEGIMAGLTPAAPGLTDTADFALSEKRQMDDWDEPLLTQTPCMRRCRMLWP